IPESLLREAATRLQDRFLFGSDYPFITPQRWLKDFEEVKIEFKPEVRKKLLWKNGQKLLANTVVGNMHFSSERDSPAYGPFRGFARLLSRLCCQFTRLTIL